MVLPVAEVRHEVFADPLGRVVADICVEPLPVANLFEWHQRNRKQDTAARSDFFLTGFRDFRADPSAAHALRRQGQQQSVVDPDGLVDLVMNPLAAEHVVRGEPAADAPILQVRIQAIREVLISRGVGDKARIELNRPGL